MLTERMHFLLYAVVHLGQPEEPFEAGSLRLT